MYLKHKVNSALLYLACFLALGICLALIVFFVHILALRTEYRAACLEINDVILQTAPDELSVSRGGQTRHLDENTLEYYNIRLLDAKTVVYSRKDGEEDDRSIVIRLGRTSSVIPALRTTAPSASDGTARPATAVILSARTM